MYRFMLFILSISTLSCSLSISKGRDGLPGLNLSDCYSDKKTVSQLKNVEATLTAIADVWCFVPTNDDTQRYGACNMVEYAFVEGQKVVFSADVKETHPNERWAYTPIVLTTLDLKK
jgi:hypothetical protein